MARILARALNCLTSKEPTTEPCGTCDLCVRASTGDDMDVLEIDAASNRKVDDARTLIAGVSFHPSRARFKVYIVDEVHMLTTEAFNALLKTLEEPPAHVKFVFATTDPQKVPPTILSRCQRFDFRPVPTRTSSAADEICVDGGLAADEALVAIARASSGMRDRASLSELGALGGRKVARHSLLLGPCRRAHALLSTARRGRRRRRSGGGSSAAGPIGGATRQCLRHTTT
jgi:DNA polymerase-3 subunit gamma/tau